MNAAKPRGTTLRLDPDLRDQLDEYARRTHRTLNSAVNYLVRVALEHESQDAKGG